MVVDGCGDVARKGRLGAAHRSVTGDSERRDRGDRGEHGGPAGAQSTLSRSPVQASSAWKRQVVDPGGLVYPKRVEVVGTASAVSDSSGLKAAGGAVTTVRSTGRGAPRLVLDLGVNTGGHVEVGITRTNGTPGGWATGSPRGS